MLLFACRMMKQLCAVLWLVIFLPTGCVVGEVGTTSASAPVAPSDLEATAVDSGGIHLMWTDNSTDEQHFMVMRMMHDDTTDEAMKSIATLSKDAVEYHDTAVESGMSYMYMIAAMNDGGESDSDAVELVAP